MRFRPTVVILASLCIASLLLISSLGNWTDWDEIWP